MLQVQSILFVSIIGEEIFALPVGVERPAMLLHRQCVRDRGTTVPRRRWVKKSAHVHPIKYHLGTLLYEQYCTHVGCRSDDTEVPEVPVPIDSPELAWRDEAGDSVSFPILLSIFFLPRTDDKNTLAFVNSN